MNRKFYLILFILGLIITPFASASLSNNLVSYYSLDTADLSGGLPQDLHGTYHAENNTATTGGTPIIYSGESFDYDGTNDYTSFGNVHNPATNPFTWSLWVNPDTVANVFLLTKGDQGTASGGIADLRIHTTDRIRFNIFGNGLGWCNLEGTTVLSAGNDYHVVGKRYSNGTIELYVNGVSEGSLSSSNCAGSVVPSVPFMITNRINSGKRDDVGVLDGTIDEVGIWNVSLNATSISALYNGGLGLSYSNITGSSPASTPYASENLEQTAFIEQSTPVTINSIAYVPVYSSSVTISDDTNAYAVVSVPITATASNTATCRVTKDGAEFGDSERIRSLSAGTTGNLIIATLNETITAGTYNFGLECYRTGGGAYTVDNSTLFLHFLTGTGGIALPHTVFNVTSATGWGVVASDTITTSENFTDNGLTRNLILEWSSSTFHDGTEMYITPELAGTNCTNIVRYGGLSTTGSVYGVCYVDVGNETNSTSYDVKIHVTSAISGTPNPSTTQEIRNAVFHVKELIAHPDNINTTSLYNAGTQTSLNKTLTLNITGHSSPNIVALSGVSADATGVPDRTGTYYFTNNTANSSLLSRSYTGNNQFTSAGVIGLQHRFSSSPTVSLIGVLTDNLYFNGGDFVLYVSDSVTDTPNEFDVTAQTVFGDSISSFSINLSDGREFSTTTGTISVAGTGELYNITISENSGATIPYYSNYTLNHNSTNNLLLNVTPYTVINASFGGTGVNNFSLNGTPTTTGKFYVRSGDYSFNVTDATANDGTNLSDTSANTTITQGQISYTFTMLTANVFNFSIYDELTEALITENMTIELITGATAGTYTTTNGTLYLELLTPSDYTIRYYSTLGSNYTERDYIQTLNDREFYNISLYSLDVDEATDLIVTVKDTGGDPVESAIVKLLRYYTSCNCYNVVEMATTSSAGESYFIVDAYDGHYKFAVEYEGETEFLSTSPENFIPDAVTTIVERTITINLGSAYFESFRELSNIARTITYNNATKGLSFTWNDPSGIVTKGCLYASYLDGVHYTDVTPACQSASVGSVVLTLNNSVASYKYYAELETSTTYSDYTVFSGVIDKISENLLNGNVGLGAFLGVGVIIIMALLFSFSAIAVVVVTAVGVIVMNVLGLFTIATGFITGFIVLIVGLSAYLMRS